MNYEQESKCIGKALEEASYKLGSANLKTVFK